VDREECFEEREGGEGNEGKEIENVMRRWKFIENNEMME
jgi:hypothetical protein